MTDKPKMYCIQCGKEIPANVQFCPYCGTAQTGVNSNETSQPSSSNNTTASTTVTPASSTKKDNMFTALKQGLVDMFTLSKRMKRATFWWLYLDIFIIGILLNLMLSPLFMKMATSDASVWSTLTLLLSIPYAATTVTLFTAEIRRLHDTNRSGHFLWLLLIPLVGPIIVIVLLTQKSKEQGSRFERLQPNKIWTKKWWTWMILLVIALATSATFVYSAKLMNMYEYANVNNTVQNNDTTADTNDDDDTDDTSNTDTIDLNGKIDVANQQSYDTDYSDSWAGSTFSIDKVTVYQTDGEYTDGSGHDKTSFNGVVKVHMTIDAGRDITAYPSQSTLNTNDGQQVDADLSDSDDFDGELNSGTQSDGNIYFLIPTLNDVSDLTSIRLKWIAYYDTDNYDDDNSDKDFDTTIQLEQ